MNTSPSLTNNVNVSKFDQLYSPIELQNRLVATSDDFDRVYQYRGAIKQILRNENNRLIVIVGPCSIHDVNAGIEYAKRLKALSDKVNSSFLVVMRVYFEKPRSSIGWKGLINDPELDGSFNMSKGLGIARQFMLDVTRIGLPIAIEALDPIVPQYLSDLVSWTAIGARTTESQTHREMASGLSSPVGFKNATDGDVNVAINAIVAAEQSHSFLGIDTSGRASVVRTVGNAFGHLVLRGSDSGPNYSSEFIKSAAKIMSSRGVNPRIIIDCSHGNSQKNPNVQAIVGRDVIEQVRAGEESIAGLMFESFLELGSQPFNSDRSQLRYGCSITDPCLGWNETESLLTELASVV